ncbi:MAG: Rieske (2Fe-2S) protein [Candidatus Kapaibacterium sp.]
MTIKQYEELEIKGGKYLRLCRSDELVEGKGLKVIIDDDLDKQVAVIRLEGKLYCLFNICPHRHADRIHEGILDKNELTVMCPLHGWTYSLETGNNINAKQGIKGLKTFEVFEDHGYIYIEKPRLDIPKWRKI